jgi:hypothetical protein
MPKGRPNQEILRRENAKKYKIEKHAKLEIMKTTDKWKEIVDALTEDTYRPINKTLSALSGLIENAITNRMFKVSKPVISAVVIKEYLREKYADDIEKKSGHFYINEIHFKELSEEEINELWNKI